MKKSILSLIMAFGVLSMAQSASALGTDRVFIKGSSCISVNPQYQPVIYDLWGIRANEANTPGGYTQADVICPISVTAPVGRTYTSAQLSIYGYNRNSATSGNDNLSCTLQATDSGGGNLREGIAKMNFVQAGVQTGTTYMSLPVNSTVFFSIKCHLPKYSTAMGLSHLTSMTLQLAY